MANQIHRWRSGGSLPARFDGRIRIRLSTRQYFKLLRNRRFYQLCEGDTVNIRFNPAKPSEYYLPGLIQSEFTRTWKLTVWALLLLVLGIGFIVFLLAH
jgi:hypothetical protein